MPFWRLQRRICFSAFSSVSGLPAFLSSCPFFHLQVFLRSARSDNDFCLPLPCLKSPCDYTGLIQVIQNHFPVVVFLNQLSVHFLVVLGVCCCGGFSLVAVNGGYSLVAVHKLLIAVASLVVHRLQGMEPSVAVVHGLSCPATRVLPRPGVEPVSPGLAGRFFTTEAAGEPSCWSLKHMY